MKISVADIECFFASRPGMKKHREEIIQSARSVGDADGIVPAELVMQIMGIFADQFIEEVIARRLSQLNEELGVF